MNRMRRPETLVVHPVLFSIFPILFLYSHNVNHLPVSEIHVPLFLCAAISVPVTAAIHYLPGARKIAALVTLFLITFFSYAHFYGLASRTVRLNPALQGGLLLYGWFFFSAAVMTLVAIKGRELKRLTSFLNAVSLILVLTASAATAGHLLSRRTHDVPAGTEAEEIVAPQMPEPLPDIYFMIFDRYASERTLKEQFGFDNSAMMTFFKDRGFFVAGKSRANYLKTAHSLASSLNLKYLDDLECRPDRNYSDWLPLYRMLEDYTLWRFFKSRGYRFLHFGSWWQPTMKNRFADMNYTISPAREFRMLFFKSTILYPLFEKSDWCRNFSNYKDLELHYERKLYKFDRLAEAPLAGEPVFCFAHMLIPHCPYVFDSSGAFLPKEKAWSRDYRRNYLDQIIFVNKKIRETVDTILSRSKVPPVIVIASDEGPFPERYRANEDSFEWLDATRDELREKFSILNALHLPHPENPDSFFTVPEDISPVNVFRLILNRYFGASFEYLPDRCIIFENNRYPYSFHDITGKLD